MLVLVAVAALRSPIVLRPGMVIDRSCQIARQSYLFSNTEGSRTAGDETIPTFTPAITIRGDGITVDFAGATLRGTPVLTAPSDRHGLGIEVIGNGITIKNLKVNGYKIGLIARRARGLKILDSDLSYNWKQHLASTPEREDLGDWMSFHHNEHDEWLRYGGAIQLFDCDGFEVRNTRVTGGQCALMLTRSNHGLVWNNDFSFNSALGIGMYRSSDNRVMHNRVDYNVRGFSYGVYNRGQDSAGILVFEQCNRNVFAYNSVTHGGDGFFLWAGQETMDTGKGGCNDNVCYANDFSHAPTNAIEATFSRNVFVGNRVHGAFHGVWGGYSYETPIVGNDFRGNQRGIAIEHGQTNLVGFNRFNGEDVGIALWADPGDPNFAYAKARDVASYGNEIIGNQFVETALALDLRQTTKTRLSGNLFVGGKILRSPAGFSPFEPSPADNVANRAIATGVPVSTTEEPPVPAPDWSPLNPISWKSADAARALAKYRVPPLPGGRMRFMSPTAPQGWSTIIVDEWGPYDYQRPLLWPEKKIEGSGAPLPGGTSAGSGTRTAAKPIATGRYQVLGPPGRWRLVSATGATLSEQSGSVPGVVSIQLDPKVVGETQVKLEYIGLPTVDHRGMVIPAGRPVQFGFSKFRAPIAWNVRFFRWKDAENPSEPHSVPRDFASVLRGPSILEMQSTELDMAGYALVKGLPNDHYATLAEGSFTIPKGTYTLTLTTDDGAKVWIDDRLVIADAWKYQGPTMYNATVELGGKHKIRVEHFQIDGYATLKVALRPKQ